MKRNNDRPLIEEAEGKDADNRASLFSAFRRLANRSDRAPITNLHVRELLMWVMASDRKGNGVQKSYPELATILETTVGTARAVVRRASVEFGLLAVIEDRHARGGQTANRYSIDWAVVREVNQGLRPVAISSGGVTQPRTALRDVNHGLRPVVVSQQAPVVGQKPPVVTQQGPVVRRQPYKEQVPEFRPEAKANTSPSSPPRSSVTPDVDGCTTPGATWPEVEEVVSKLLTKWKPAVRAARDQGLTPEAVLAIVAHQQNSDHRLGPGALYFRLVNAHPSVSPDAGWVPSQKASLASILGQGGAIRADTTVRANCVIAEVIARGRREGRSQAEIERAIDRRLEHEGLARPE